MIKIEIKLSKKNKMYDRLPVELIREIYFFDGTFKVKYDKIVSIITSFPKFHKHIGNQYHFIKEYNFFKNHIEDTFYTVNDSYKKGFLIVVRNFVRKGTFKDRNLSK